MTVDPRRRFTFGFSVQNRQMRLWFACRGVVLVTKTFDVFTVRAAFIFPFALLKKSPEPRTISKIFRLARILFAHCAWVGSHYPASPQGFFSGTSKLSYYRRKEGLYYDSKLG